MPASTIGYLLTTRATGQFFLGPNGTLTGWLADARIFATEAEARAVADRMNPVRLQCGASPLVPRPSRPGMVSDPE